MMQFPQFGLVRQNYPESTEPQIGKWLADELKRTNVFSKIKPGDRVLITAGSRGIDSKPEVLRCLVQEVKAAGGNPVIYPGMGSHGGGTAAGQVEVLQHLGITEKTVGAPIYNDLGYVEINHPISPIPLYADKAAAEADHIILVNRVKEHTEYMGDTESGLLKMAVVGLGRQQGAEAMHHLAVNISYYKAIHAVATALFDRLNILAGVALIEDHRNTLRRLEVIPAAEIFDREPALLEESRATKPKLPFEELDVLIIDEIGKEISGTGADTKVVGRIMNIYEKECTSPKILRIIIRDLTEDTGGNAIGIGLADYITKKVFQKIDFEKTALNSITGGTPEKGRIPIALPTDLAALETAFRTIGVWKPETVKVAWIENTKHLEWLAASTALLESCAGRKDVQVRKERFSLPFQADGSLPRLETFLNGASHRKG